MTNISSTLHQEIFDFKYDCKELGKYQEPDCNPLKAIRLITELESLVEGLKISIQEGKEIHAEEMRELLRQPTRLKDSKIPKELIYYGGDEYPDWVSEELMLAQLLMDGVACVNDVHWCFKFYEAKEQIETKNYCGPRFQLKEGVDPKEDTVCCFVNINDIFCYGADGTNVTTKELRSLYEHHMDFNNEYNGWGLVIWAIKKEKLKPIPKVLEPMIADGMWTEELEQLVTKKEETEI